MKKVREKSRSSVSSSGTIQALPTYRKGIVDVEFVLAIIVFLSIISFVSYSIISNIPVFRTEAENNDLRSKAYQLSQLLLLDEGVGDFIPGTGNWVLDVDNPLVGLNGVRLGLSADEKYVLVRAKVDKLDDLCNGIGPLGYDYPDLRAWFFGSAPRNDFRIELTDGTTQFISCNLGAGSTSRREFQIVRFGVLNGEVIKMTVSVS